MRVPIRKGGKFTNLAVDPLLTAEKFSALEKKLARLQAERPQAIAEVKRLAELGDFSENMEYQMAKGRLRGLNSAMENLVEQLNQAEIIRSPKNAAVVAVGHTVVVEVSGQRKTFKILGSTEINPRQGIISYSSPLGAALLGHAVGDIIKIKLPGKEVCYKILEIA